MLPAEIIKKKRSGLPLTENEIKSFVDGYVHGTVADYQMSAFLMAVFFKGMNQNETWNLTNVMLHSGDIVDFGDSGNSKTPKISRIDKHSTGGVGDKTSLIIAPIVACAGVQVPMISGRGLGHTGGTLDKLESIPGFDVNLSIAEFKKQVQEVGACFIGQTKDICPADKKMYALRDVTGTVECVPLICSSIMSKKLAEGIDGLVLDIKTGSGAFMKKTKDAINLAKVLKQVGTQGGKKISALITDMSQPLGLAVGNSLEVQECIDILMGKGPADLRELSLELAAQMILLGGKCKTFASAKKLSQEILDSGSALKRFEEIVLAQKGKLSNLPKATKTYEVLSQKKGFVFSVNAEKIGLASLCLGAGRAKADDKIDPSAGIMIHKKIGDQVEKRDRLATLYFNEDKNLEESIGLVKSSYLIRLHKTKRPRLIIKKL